jgi:hypothetical protein
MLLRQSQFQILTHLFTSSLFSVLLLLVSSTSGSVLHFQFLVPLWREAAYHGPLCLPPVLAVLKFKGKLRSMSWILCVGKSRRFLDGARVVGFVFQSFITLFRVVDRTSISLTVSAALKRQETSLSPDWTG